MTLAMVPREMPAAAASRFISCAQALKLCVGLQVWAEANGARKITIAPAPASAWMVREDIVMSGVLKFQSGRCIGPNAGHGRSFDEIDASLGGWTVVGSLAVNSAA